MSPRHTPELFEMAEQVGEFIQYWGFKRVHGRIWCHLFLSCEAIDAAEIMSRLKISKALVSITVRELLEYKVISEDGKSKNGTQLYVANPKVMDVVLNVLRKRERKMLSQIHAAHRMLNSLTPTQLKELNIDQVRLKSLGEMVGTAEKGLDALLVFGQMDFTGLEQFRHSECEADQK
jgi:DNA-binding transcriptional regulator GbsR (MarR family)